MVYVRSVSGEACATYSILARQAYEDGLISIQIETSQGWHHEMANMSIIHDPAEFWIDFFTGDARLGRMSDNKLLAKVRLKATCKVSAIWLNADLPDQNTTEVHWQLNVTTYNSEYTVDTVCFGCSIL